MSENNLSKLYLAGGCFWGMEELLRKLPGVVKTTVGYTGGDKLPSAPTYPQVKTGKTGFAEAVEVVFDTKLTSYEKILEFFFKIHDPTTVNRQGNDVGTQYRSAIFYQTPNEKTLAENVIQKLVASKKFAAVVVTKLEPFEEFFPAEDYHQAYLQKNPGGYTCHFIRN